MKLPNPTDLHPGMTGRLAERRYRVAGRIVLGTEVAGEVYYWNEFHLVEDSGETATLVFEMGDDGPEWRIFRLLEPDQPMTAAEAAQRRVGDRWTFNGTEGRIELIGQSRVYEIEGEAPEGVEVGDVAQYFNVVAGKALIVASWTGDEIEYYRGLTVSAETVAQAFGLAPPSVSHISDASPGFVGWRRSIVPAIMSGVMLLTVLGGAFSCRSSRGRNTVSKWPAAASQLNLGSSGRLDGTYYRIDGHVVMEIATVGDWYERHEYSLLDADGKRALLVLGLQAKGTDWVLYRPVDPLLPRTPQRAAAMVAGDRIEFAGLTVTVSQLFRAKVQQYDGESSPLPERRVDGVTYNLSGREAEQYLLGRWSESDIAFYLGKRIPGPEVLAAFPVISKK